jgi:hypothetical protein
MQPTPRGFSRFRITSLARGLRTIILWSFWFVLAAIWGATLIALSDDGHARHWVDSLLIILSLVVLFFAEGLELAVADLLDKHPDQLSDVRLRKLLQEIQQNSDFFFSTRQVFVVLIITFMSLTTNYPWIAIPYLGRISQYDAPFWFSLAFTSLTVLWFCQVAPKRLAVMNSELFLKHSAFLWPLIKATGLVGLPYASDQIVWFFRKFTPYRKKRHLRPSPAAHYNTTSQIHGISLDRVHVEISASTVGFLKIRKRIAVIFLRGMRSNHSEKFYCQERMAALPQLSIVGLYTGPSPERLEMITPELDNMFLGKSPNGEFAKIENWSNHTSVRVDDDILRGGQWASWTIWSGRPLPESLSPPSDDMNQNNNSLAVLVYEIEFDIPELALDSLGENNGFEKVWPEYFGHPCRSYAVRLKYSDSLNSIGLQGCDVRLHPGDLTVPEETLRCSRLAILASNHEFEVGYPLQGAVYTVRWWDFDKRAPASERTTVLPEFVSEPTRLSQAAE